MNRTLMSALLASGAIFATGAMAADLPATMAAPAPYIAAVPVFTWTGFYIGALAGANFNNSNTPTFTPGGLPGSPNLLPAIGGNNDTSFTGGGEIGYNWQVNSFVFGVEGDIDYMGGNNNLNGTYTSPAFYAFFPTYTIAGATNNHLFGTVRGRLGWAVDRALFYVTGGAAFGGNQAPTSISFLNAGGVACGACVFNSSSSNDRVGAVLGGGIEYAFSNNWSAKVEYLHTFYGSSHVVYTNIAAQTFTTSGNNLDTNIARVGLNYKF